MQITKDKLIEIEAEISRLISEGLNEKNYVAQIGNLRKKHDFETTSLIIDQAVLRPKAEKKFPFASKMFFTKEALEQSSSQVISEYRAKRFVSSKGVVYDLGCGIGIDGINIAKNVNVISIDSDEKRIQMAQLNAQAYGVEKNMTFEKLDYTDDKFLSDLRKRKDVLALFIDPSRRNSQGKRINDFELYEPSLEFVNSLLEICQNICVKVGPGIDYLELFTIFDQPFDVEIVSVNGECREAILWFGNLRKNSKLEPQISAVLLPREDIVTEAISNLDEEAILLDEELGEYIYEPSGAVTRAHLDQKLVEQYTIHRFSHDIIYLTGDKVIVSPFLKCYKVEAIFHYSVNEINEYIRNNAITEVTLKKRGVEIDIDSLYSKLEIPYIENQQKSQIFIITKVKAETKIIAVKRVKSNQEE